MPGLKTPASSKNKPSISTYFLFISVYFYLFLFISYFNIFLISFYFNLFQLISTYFYLFQLISTYFNLFPISIYFNLFLLFPPLLLKYTHRLLHECRYWDSLWTNLFTFPAFCAFTCFAIDTAIARKPCIWFIPYSRMVQSSQNIWNFHAR